jgi:hypothetical protein
MKKTHSFTRLAQFLSLILGLFLLSQCADLPTLNTPITQKHQHGTSDIKKEGWVIRYNETQVIDSVRLIDSAFTFVDQIEGSSVFVRFDDSTWSIPSSATSTIDGIDYSFSQESWTPFPMRSFNIQSNEDDSSRITFNVNISVLSPFAVTNLNSLLISPKADSTYPYSSSSNSDFDNGSYTSSANFNSTSITKSSQWVLQYKNIPDSISVLMAKREIVNTTKKNILNRLLQKPTVSKSTSSSTSTAKSINLNSYIRAEVLSISPQINFEITSSNSNYGTLTLRPRFGDWPAGLITMVLKKYSTWYNFDTSLYRIDTLTFSGSPFKISQIKDIEFSTKSATDSTWILWTALLDSTQNLSPIKSSTPLQSAIRADTLWLYWKNLTDTLLNIQIKKGILDRQGFSSLDSISLQYRIRP